MNNEQLNKGQMLHMSHVDDSVCAKKISMLTQLCGPGLAIAGEDSLNKREN